jgi:hypothetical protein
VEEWLRGKSEIPKPHPLETELAKTQKVLDAVQECPPLWWADKLPWKGLRWFFGMRQCRIRDASDDLFQRGSEKQQSKQSRK